MKTAAAHLNLTFAWAWILCGFASGMLLGLGFHRDEWLGGYGSLRRRLYRLGHIAFFALGAANLLFALTAERLPPTAAIGFASTAFIVGAVTMPLCCFVMAHRPGARMLFAIPIVSLLVAASLTLLEVSKL